MQKQIQDTQARPTVADPYGLYDRDGEPEHELKIVSGETKVGKKCDKYRH